MRRALMTAAALSTALVLAVPGTATADSHAPKKNWPSPGEGANSSVEPIPVTGSSLSLQERREPLVLIGEEQKGKKRLLTLSNDVLFDTDSAQLSSASRKTLEEVAKRIKESGAKGPVKVVGHTDTDGTNAYNKKLSTDRAKAVVAALKPRLSGTDTELRAVGKGETDLAVEPEKSEADKAQNRRVTITYTTTQVTQEDDDEELGDIAVPPTQTAKEATGPPAEGSLASVQSTVSFTGGEATIQMDVVTFKRQGPFLLMRARLYGVSVPEDTAFNEVGSLFSGSTYDDELSNTVLYSKREGAKLLPIISGKGAVLTDGYRGLNQGTSSTVWFYFTPPEHEQKTLDLYVPAFGVVRGLEPKG